MNYSNNKNKKRRVWIPFFTLLLVTSTTTTTAFTPTTTTTTVAQRRLHRITWTPTKTRNGGKRSIGCSSCVHPWRRQFSFSSLYLSSLSSSNNKDTTKTTRSFLSSLIEFLSTSKFISSWYIQSLIVLSFYVFHTILLTQGYIAFPVQLIPNSKGHFASVGYDSLAGMISLAIYLLCQKQQTKSSSVPWRDLLPTQQQQEQQSTNDNRIEPATTTESATTTDTTNSNNRIVNLQKKLFSFLPSSSSSTTQPAMKQKTNNTFQTTQITSCIALLLLIQAYFLTGRLSLFWEDLLYSIAGIGFVMTIPMHRSLCVLLGHLSWVVIGSCILKFIPRPFFFANPPAPPTTDEEDDRSTFTTNDSHEDTNDPNEQQQQQDEPQQEKRNNVPTMSFSSSVRRWYQTSQKSTTTTKKKLWVWYVIGGYCISSWLFNVSDLVNHYLLPNAIFMDTIANEGVVTQLINPENNDKLASLIGFIAPCITAPWWEEILYRGFTLPTLALLFHNHKHKDPTTNQTNANTTNKTSTSGTQLAIFISGIIFSAHHMSLVAAIPLAVLGWTWAWLYITSDNLWTTIIIHALWNSRVFLSSWLGL